MNAARGKMALDLVVLDLRGLSDVTDTFVICHGTSDRQAQAIADAIEERLAVEFGRRAASVEGRRQGEWILLDFLDFVVHVFAGARRQFYRLERLWGDAPRLEVPELPPHRAPARSTSTR